MPTRAYTFTCEICKVEFTRKTLKAQFCSVGCRNQVAAVVRRWKAEEDEYLLGLIGRYQPKQIFEKWNIEAKKRGWYQRTKAGLDTRITDLCKVRGMTSKATTDNWTGSELARVLDIKRDRVKNWINQGLVVERSDYDGEVYKGSIIIKRKCLVDFALSRPEMFHTIAIPKLTKVLRNRDAITLLKKVNTKPLNYRGCSIVRLDTGAIYKDAVEAAHNTGLSSKAILYNIKEADSPMLNGSDWARVEYPIYVVPLAIRERFSFEAARIFYQIYLDLVEIDGYSKRSVMVVALRMTVQITFMAFRRQSKQLEKDIQITPIEEIQEYWRKKFIENIKKFYGRAERNCFETIQHQINLQTHGFAVGRKKYELEEFACWLYNKYSDRYTSNEFLPINYQPKTKLEKADYYGFIFGILFAWVDIGKKRMRLTSIMFLTYAAKYLPLSTVEYNEMFLNHNQSISEELDMNKEEWKEQIICAVDAAKQGDDNLLNMLASVLEKHFNEYQKKDNTQLIPAAVF